MHVAYAMYQFLYCSAYRINRSCNCIASVILLVRIRSVVNFVMCHMPCTSVHGGLLALDKIRACVESLLLLFVWLCPWESVHRVSDVCLCSVDPLSFISMWLCLCRSIQLLIGWWMCACVLNIYHSPCDSAHVVLFVIVWISALIRFPLLISVSLCPCDPILQ